MVPDMTCCCRSVWHLLLKIHTPGIPTLLVWAILMILEVSDPGMVLELIPSPALIPARASVP